MKKIWLEMPKQDKNKIDKAGFAAPRGGSDSLAYQNHVRRDNKVIIPLEKYGDVPLHEYKDGYIVRVWPEQYFKGLAGDLTIGENAFVLYRTHESLFKYPPLAEWQIRKLEMGGESVSKRSRTVVDKGHFVKRLVGCGKLEPVIDGPPQGIFAPEYADTTTNFLCQTKLAWLITRTINAPHNKDLTHKMGLILKDHDMFDLDNWIDHGIINDDLVTTCPLCHKVIHYHQLHEAMEFLNTVDFGMTTARTTVVNLFHLIPLCYEKLIHTPKNVSWGHSECNKILGQQICHPKSALKSATINCLMSEDGSMIKFSGRTYFCNN